jgi:hypothetical protein
MPDRDRRGVEQPSDDLVVDIDLYDHEVLKIEKVVGALNRTRATKSTTVEGWRNEIEQRFAEAGFKVNIVLQQIDEIQAEGKATQKDGRIFTTISIVGRIEEMHVGEFDHERQGAEVRANLLGRNTSGYEPAKKTFGMGTRRTASGLYVSGSN